MGEDRDAAQDRVSIQEAARRLGVKEDAIRKRIQRGTLRHEKTKEGRVFVWVDTAQDATRDTTEDTYQDTHRGALIEAKDETITTLREQLEAERRANEENRRIIAMLTSRIPELPPSPGSASSQEPSEWPTEATEQPGRVGPQTPLEGPQGGVERPWWRRMFGR